MAGWEFEDLEQEERIRIKEKEARAMLALGGGPPRTAFDVPAVQDAASGFGDMLLGGAKGVLFDGPMDLAASIPAAGEYVGGVADRVGADPLSSMGPVGVGASLLKNVGGDYADRVSNQSLSQTVADVGQLATSPLYANPLLGAGVSTALRTSANLSDEALGYQPERTGAERAEQAGSIFGSQMAPLAGLRALQGTVGKMPGAKYAPIAEQPAAVQKGLALGEQQGYYNKPGLIKTGTAKVVGPFGKMAPEGKLTKHSVNVLETIEKQTRNLDENIIATLEVGASKSPFDVVTPKELLRVLPTLKEIKIFKGLKDMAELPGKAAEGIKSIFRRRRTAIEDVDKVARYRDPVIEKKFPQKNVPYDLRPGITSTQDLVPLIEEANVIIQEGNLLGITEGMAAAFKDTIGSFVKSVGSKPGVTPGQLVRMREGLNKYRRYIAKEFNDPKMAQAIKGDQPSLAAVEESIAAIKKIQGEIDFILQDKVGQLKVYAKKTGQKLDVPDNIFTKLNQEEHALHVIEKASEGFNRTTGQFRVALPPEAARDPGINPFIASTSPGQTAMRGGAEAARRIAGEADPSPLARTQYAEGRGPAASGKINQLFSIGDESLTPQPGPPLRFPGTASVLKDPGLESLLGETLPYVSGTTTPLSQGTPPTAPIPRSVDWIRGNKEAVMRRAFELTQDHPGQDELMGAVASLLEAPPQPGQEQAFMAMGAELPGLFEQPLTLPNTGEVMGSYFDGKIQDPEEKRIAGRELELMRLSGELSTEAYFAADSALTSTGVYNPQQMVSQQEMADVGYSPGNTITTEVGTRREYGY